jgi:hypothetical protein
MPILKGLLEIDVVVDTLQQALGTVLFKEAVQIPSALAKILVARVSQRKIGEAQMGKRGGFEASDVIKEVDAVIGRFPIAPGADD